MTEFEKAIAVNLRRIFRKVLGYEDKFETTSDNSDYVGQTASNIIRDGLNGDLPFAVSRFGHSELGAVLTYMNIQDPGSTISKLLPYLKGKKVEPWWHPNTIKKITHNAGVFPAEIEVIEAFCRLILKEMKSIDVLGSWLGGEVWIKPLMNQTKFIRFHDFYHFLHDDPWTDALAGKKILVIHPFARSIESQYLIREKIFSGRHTLPQFELMTYASVQSIAGNIPPGFTSWFDALDRMKTDIASMKFDIAILGCGAYGMPLATFIKNEMKKKAVHLGGNTQILFGIKGSRWESDPVFAPIFNEFWSKPLPEETPRGHKSIDENCYW